MPEQHIQPDGGKDVDAALRALLSATPRGVPLTQTEIARACGCSMQLIQQIEYRALEKLRDSEELRKWE
jgi:DNA-directed RNA polymerase sigma subunit (sigma70/sigma32)